MFKLPACLHLYMLRGKAPLSQIVKCMRTCSPTEPPTYKFTAVKWVVLHPVSKTNCKSQTTDFHLNWDPTMSSTGPLDKATATFISFPFHYLQLSYHSFLHKL